jgi:hypothetical protein
MLTRAPQLDDNAACAGAPVTKPPFLLYGAVRLEFAE